MAVRESDRWSVKIPAPLAQHERDVLARHYADQARNVARNVEHMNITDGLSVLRQALELMERAHDFAKGRVG
jgi:hypothetical protein